MPLDQTWEPLPNLTMLGDAAHVMPPFAGEGVNMAMLDALELTECLTSGKYNTTLEAIAAFESNMRSRAALIAQESLDNGERMHSANSLDTMLGFFGGH
jgi:2-polyprenyl-6-methoxyphenol hydroxylase-like FAD-dependent oxidoreductase